VDLCARRAREYLKYSDGIWMETPTPSILDASEFSIKVK